MAAPGLRYDVAVVGGGSAGLAAAVTAARCGARTALVERYGFLGGMATAGLVSTICGLYHTSSSGPPRLLNEGFAAAFAARLAAMPGCGPPVRRGRTFVLPYTGFAFAALADEMTAAAARLDVYLHACLAGVTTSGRRIEALHAVTWEGALDVEATVFIDTSGDGLVAHRAAAATESLPVSARQLPALVFVLQHVVTEGLSPGARVAVVRALVEAERSGRVPKSASHLALAPSPQPGEVVCKLTLGGIVEELRPGRDFLTVAEQEGRRRALAVVEFLRTLAPFRHAFVSHAAPQVGVRESRRIVGRSTLTRDAVLTARKCPDGVGRASWPIELWHDGELGATYEYLPDGESYDIPLGCLEARDLDNLFMAGRCMSATHEALGSARVIGTCLVAGEAAGRAAADRADGRSSP